MSSTIDMRRIGDHIDERKLMLSLAAVLTVAGPRVDPMLLEYTAPIQAMIAPETRE
jgi:hypothetical protein